jgi:hypothetical protein
MIEHTLTATSLIIGWPTDSLPRKDIVPGTRFKRSDFAGHATLLASIDRAVAKGGCLVDGHVAGEVRPVDDGKLTLTETDGKPMTLTVTPARTANP